MCHLLSQGLQQEQWTSPGGIVLFNTQKHFLIGAVQQAIDQAVHFFFLSSAFPIRVADFIVTEIL